MSNTRIRKGGKIKQCRLGPLASGAAAVVLFLKAEGNTVGGTKWERLGHGWQAGCPRCEQQGLIVKVHSGGWN